jgi:hypothetical protein
VTALCRRGSKTKSRSRCDDGRAGKGIRLTRDASPEERSQGNPIFLGLNKYRTRRYLAKICPRPSSRVVTIDGTRRVPFVVRDKFFGSAHDRHRSRAGWVLATAEAQRARKLLFSPGILIFVWIQSIILPREEMILRKCGGDAGHAPSIFRHRHHTGLCVYSPITWSPMHTSIVC